MSFKAFERGLYEYYCRHTASPVDRDAFKQQVVDYKQRPDKYLVYVGYSKKDTDKKRIIYVGTTIQHPMSRWYYHSIHGKDLVFVEYCRFDNERDMLEKEFELIKKHHPSCNKITSRIQNFNAPVSDEELNARIGNPEWCQCCLKRRVSPGYKYCYYCS